MAAYLQVPGDCSVLAPIHFVGRYPTSNAVVGIRGFEPPVTFSAELLVQVRDVRSQWKLTMAEAADYSRPKLNPWQMSKP